MGEMFGRTEKITTAGYNTWIKPLQVEEKPGFLRILAPNDFVYDALEEKYLSKIKNFLFYRLP